MASVSECELSSISISSIPPHSPQTLHINPLKASNPLKPSSLYGKLYSLDTVIKPSLYRKLYSLDTVIILICSTLVIMFIITLITLILGMTGAL